MTARGDHRRLLSYAWRAGAGFAIALMGYLLIGFLMSAGAAFAQELPIEVSPGPSKPATRPESRALPESATRLPEASLYPRDVGVRHDPAFIEPLGKRYETRTGGRGRLGLSGWTAPNVPIGEAQSEASEVNGWFSLGFTLTWGDPR